VCSAEKKRVPDIVGSSVGFASSPTWFVRNSVGRSAGPRLSRRRVNGAGEYIDWRHESRNGISTPRGAINNSANSLYDVGGSSAAPRRANLGGSVIAVRDWSWQVPEPATVGSYSRFYDTTATASILPGGRWFGYGLRSVASKRRRRADDGGFCADFCIYKLVLAVGLFTRFLHRWKIVGARFPNIKIIYMDVKCRLLYRPIVCEMQYVVDV